MAIDNKYGRVTFERGDIGEDEPVFVIRAQDELAPAAIEAYGKLCKAHNCRPEHLAGIQYAKDLIEAWQSWPDNFTKLPESQ